MSQRLQRLTIDEDCKDPFAERVQMNEGATFKIDFDEDREMVIPQVCCTCAAVHNWRVYRMNGRVFVEITGDDEASRRFEDLARGRGARLSTPPNEASRFLEGKVIPEE